MSGAAEQAVLARLIDKYPLAERWGEPVLYADQARIGDVSISMCGLVVRDRDGNQATGSAADVTDVPLPRAYFELVERTSVLEAMERSSFELLNEVGEVTGYSGVGQVFPRSQGGAAFRYARSNGVAVALSWKHARRQAWLELIERDRVLAAWYGQFEPRRLAFKAPSTLAGLRDFYELEVYAFDCDGLSGIGPRVRGVFAFPLVGTAPLSYGFAAGATATDAFARALRECVQRIAFLWGESIPIEEPSFAATPEFHQEFYLRPSMHSHLRAWLSGDHARSRVSVMRSAAQRCSHYVDLTPSALSSGLSVVRALPGPELPLVFGMGHPALRGEIAPRFAVHPIA